MKLSVLLVDDCADALTLASRALRPMSVIWDLRLATSAVEARKELKRRRVDIIVADVRMPGEDGIALLRYVEKEHSSVRRVTLTDHLDHFVAGPAEARICKPLTPSSLRQVVATLCYRRNSKMDDDAIVRT